MKGKRFFPHYYFILYGIFDFSGGKVIGVAVEISHALLKTGEDLLIICRYNSPRHWSKPCIRLNGDTCELAGKFCSALPRK